MSLKFHWYLPTSGDGRILTARGGGLPDMDRDTAPASRLLGAAAAQRPPSVGYLAQIARAAEQLGFEGVLTPTGTWCEDAWLTTAALISETERPRA
jgi:alkanesulfonate monooxygenase